MEIRTVKADQVIGRPIDDTMPAGLVRDPKWEHRRQVRRVEVVAVGQKHQDQLKPGDTLIIGNFPATIKYKGEELFVLEEDEIFAVEE